MHALLHHLKKAIPQRSPLRLAWHHARAFAAALRFGFPARSLTVIGITGTDGKTTTVGMVAHILEHTGIAAGALSTAFLQVRDHMEWNTTQKTSPSPFLIQGFLRRLVREGCTHAVIEASSHGLVQGRLHFTRPLIAAVTNVSPEHLDYHETMEQYRRDKGILFRMLRKGGVKVLNAADESFSLYEAIPTEQTVLWAGTEEEVRRGQRGKGGQGGKRGLTLLWFSDVYVTANGSSAVLHAEIQERANEPTLLRSHGATEGQASQRANVSLAIPGSFNLENALAAVGCAMSLGIPMSTCAEALATFRGVAGRMERISEGQPFSVFVDFTVTPAAYEKTLTALRAMLPAGRRLLVLTGSCGDRMREKRPLVGAICSRLADVVVITNEDPYTEDPETIIEEVWAGIDQSKTEACKIFDRREAIRFLFSKAEPGDIVVLCAKGADTTMMTAEGQIPWNEREIAREILRKMKAT
ncbi:MAG: UDP-N-acetylmuramoyl-L-alanyl-D-glutamate--2,6-diaminopimelate ligase [Candidatus Peregrinibacteria bacterium]